MYNLTRNVTEYYAEAGITNVGHSIVNVSFLDFKAKVRLGMPVVMYWELLVKTLECRVRVVHVETCYVVLYVAMDVYMKVCIRHRGKPRVYKRNICKGVLQTST